MSSFSSHPEPTLNQPELRAWALDVGFAEAGFVTLPHGNEARDAARFEDWVRAGRAATMHYMTRKAASENGEAGQLVRARVSIPFPWARSAIVCFANYNSAHPRSTEPAPPEAGWVARYAWTSRVDATGTRRPSDYHKVLLKQLRALEARIREQHGNLESRAYVDTGPVIERALATAAGLGWTAKNTCLIHPQLGSYGFLAVLLTSMPVQYECRVPHVSILRPGIAQPPTNPHSTSHKSGVPQVPRFWEPGIAQDPTNPHSTSHKSGVPQVPRFWEPGIAQDPTNPHSTSHKSRVPQVPRFWGPGIAQDPTSTDPQKPTTSEATPVPHSLQVPDRCGTCRRCLDACPTGALFAPYQMDASLCISYLTIEHRGPIAPHLMELTGRQVFGCDICQDVCPWNRKSPIAAGPDLAPRPELVNPSLDWLASLDEPAFERIFNGSPVRRAGFLGLRRNVAVAMGNSRLARFTPYLEAWSAAADAGLRAAARWALAKLHSAPTSR